jgi:hypothetical protein
MGTKKDRTSYLFDLWADRFLSAVLQTVSLHYFFTRTPVNDFPARISFSDFRRRLWTVGSRRNAVTPTANSIRNRGPHFKTMKQMSPAPPPAAPMIVSSISYTSVLSGQLARIPGMRVGRGACCAAPLVSISFGPLLQWLATCPRTACNRHQRRSKTGCGWVRPGTPEDTAEGGSEAKGGRALPDSPPGRGVSGRCRRAPRQSVARLVVVIRRRALPSCAVAAYPCCSWGVTRCQWGYPSVNLGSAHPRAYASRS